MHPTTPATRPAHEHERGQILVIFALGIVAIIAMTGLVIDGGATFVQKREQQNVVDAAAMAGAYAYLNSDGDASQAVAAAQKVAADNGYAHGVGGATVGVSVVAGDGEGVGTVAVSLTRPHRNYFSGVVGFTSWDVTATATAISAIPNAAGGVLPLIFNEVAWTEAAQDPDNPLSFGEPPVGSDDVPQTATQFNWTVFCLADGNPCNADSATVEDLIATNDEETTIDLAMEIGPLNAGSHTTLFNNLADRVGEAYPVAIVSDDGEMLGWALFHLTGSVGGATKQISGYFETMFNEPPFIISPNGGSGSSMYGAYIVQLTN